MAAKKVEWIRDLFPIFVGDLEGIYHFKIIPSAHTRANRELFPVKQSNHECRCFACLDPCRPIIECAGWSLRKFGIWPSKMWNKWKTIGTCKTIYCNCLGVQFQWTTWIYLFTIVAAAGAPYPNWWRCPQQPQVYCGGAPQFYVACPIEL